MIRIAICDDLISDIEMMKAHIARYARETSLQIDVKAFNAEEDIIATLGKASDYDLLFVDVYMKTLNGIDLARQIKRQGAKSRIVFFSSSKTDALKAFGVNAIQYLVKPVSYDEFVNAIKLALVDKAHREEAINVKSGDGVAKIELYDFVYSEAQKNYQYIYLADGSAEKAKISCTELYNMLGHRRDFVKLGASYIVNLNYIKRISPSEVLFKDGRKIHVPRGSFPVLKQQYHDYYGVGGIL